MESAKKHIRAWEKEYGNQPCLWRGPADIEPMARYLTPGKKILELGCGNGKILRPLLDGGYDVFGIDISSKSLKNLGRESSGKGKLVCCDGLNLPFRDSSFDTLISFFFLDHLLEKERSEAIREFHRVLSTGGKLLLRTFSTVDMRFRNYNPVDSVEMNTITKASGIVTHFFQGDEIWKMLSPFFNILEAKEEQKSKTYSGKRYVRASHFAVGEKKGD